MAQYTDTVNNIVYNNNYYIICITVCDIMKIAIISVSEKGQALASNLKEKF